MFGKCNRDNCKFEHNAENCKHKINMKDGKLTGIENKDLETFKKTWKISKVQADFLNKLK